MTKKVRFWHIHTRWGRMKEKFHRLVDQQLVEIKEKPSRLALGCAFGLSVNFFPTMGLGFLFAFILALIFRVNKVGATAISLITGPLIPIKYTLNLLTGGLIQAGGEGYDLFQILSHQYAQIFKLGGFRDKLFSFLEFFGSTFMLGAIINAAIFGACFYILVMLIVTRKLGKNNQ